MGTIQVSKRHSFTGHRDCVYALQPGGRPHLFFSGAGDGLVVQWDLQNPGDGEPVAKLPHSVYALLHLADKKLLAAAGQNFSGIHLIDYQNKKEVASLQLTSSYIFDIQSFENDFVIGTGDGTLIVVDVENWAVKKRIVVSEKSARAIS